MAPIEDLTKRLGLRGLIKRGGETWRTPEIKSLDKQISDFNKTYFLLNKSEYAGTEALKIDIEFILQSEGPKLWPDNSDRVNDCQWLYRVGDVPEYPENLYFSLHAQRIRPLFEDLLMIKLDRYHVNHRIKRGRLPSESTLTEFSSVDQGVSPKSLVLAIKFPPGRKQDLKAILEKPPSPTRAWVEAHGHIKRKNDTTQDRSKPPKRLKVDQQPEDASNVQYHLQDPKNHSPTRLGFARCDSVGIPEPVHGDVEEEKAQSSDTNDDDDGDVYVRLPNSSVHSSSPDSLPPNPATPGLESAWNLQYALKRGPIAKQLPLAASFGHEAHDVGFPYNVWTDGKPLYDTQVTGGKASSQAATPNSTNSASRSKSLIRRTNWVHKGNPSDYVSPYSTANAGPGETLKEQGHLLSPQTGGHGTSHPSSIAYDTAARDNDERNMHHEASMNINDHVPFTTTQSNTIAETAKPPTLPKPQQSPPQPTNLTNRFIDIILVPSIPDAQNQHARKMVELSSCPDLNHLFTKVKILKKTLKDRNIEDIVVRFKDSTVDDALNWDISNDRSGQYLWEQLLRVLAEKTSDFCPVEARIEV